MNEYRARRYGMDHERYAWSMLQDRPPLRWPDGKPLAVWFNVSLQHFPLNPGAKVRLPGSMTMPYPDLRHFTLRDHGNRVGIWRLFDAFDAVGVQPSYAINAALVERAPPLMDEIASRGAEVIAHSWNMDTPHAGELDDEAALVARSLAALRARFAQPVQTWLGPGRLQTASTPELLRRHGIKACADWVNDELPYRFHTAHGDLWNLPLPTETEDRFVILDNLHSEASWAEQVSDAFDWQLRDAQASGAGRLFSLSVHPWVLGQAHRIRHLRSVLAHINAQRAHCWFCGPRDLVALMEAQ